MTSLSSHPRRGHESSIARRPQQGGIALSLVPFVGELLPLHPFVSENRLDEPTSQPWPQPWRSRFVLRLFSRQARPAPVDRLDAVGGAGRPESVAVRVPEWLVGELGHSGEPALGVACKTCRTGLHSRIAALRRFDP